MLDLSGATVAASEREILVIAFSLMLIIVVPVFVLTAWFAFRYRASADAAYEEELDHTPAIEIATWIVPALLVFAIATLVWNNTHRLDPFKPLAGTPTVVHAIAQDWKWLFIYPDLGIATVNELAFPADGSLDVRITSDAALNSFMIPELGGQIYAMAGMVTRLNLKSDGEGVFEGRNMQFNGEGFTDQRFQALALSQEDYEAWVDKVRASANALTDAGYADLLRPSVDHPVTYFATVDAGLFAKVIAKHNHAAGHTMGMAE